MVWDIGVIEVEGDAKMEKKCVRQTANFPLKKIVCLIFTLTVFAYKPLKSSLPSNQTTGKKKKQ